MPDAFFMLLGILSVKLTSPCELVAIFVILVVPGLKWRIAAVAAGSAVCGLVAYNAKVETSRIMGWRAPDPAIIDILITFVGLAAIALIAFAVARLRQRPK